MYFPPVIVIFAEYLYLKQIIVHNNYKIKKIVKGYNTIITYFQSKSIIN